MAAFDDHAGVGEVEVPAAVPRGEAIRYWFHCTRLLDGTRHAEVGQRVWFSVVPGHRGCWEATAIG